jgi:CHAT domain-containing protein
MASRLFRIWLFLASAFLILFLYSHFSPRPHVPASSRTVDVREPLQTLEEAKRLAWLGNWEKARPLFASAQNEFERRNDQRNAIYAQVGYLRATIESHPYSEVSAAVAQLLGSRAVQQDPHLKIWCLSVKGYADLNQDTKVAERTWTAAYQIALSLNDQRWLPRIVGELGIIDYLEGNRQRAVVRVGDAILSAREAHDVDSEIRYLAMLGDGFIEERRYWFAKLFLEHAIHVAESNNDVGFPFLAYQGEAAALLGSGDYRKAKALLDVVLRNARDQQRPGQEGLTLLLLGNYAAKIGDRKLAKQDWNDAINVFTKIQAYRPLSEAYFNVAMIQRTEGDLTAAEKSLSAGVSSSRKIGDRIYLPRDLTALAEGASLQGRLVDAEKWYQQAEDTFEELSLRMNTSYGAAGFAEARSQTYTEHFSLLEKQGRIPEAFQVIERVRGLANVERRRRMLPLNTTPELSALQNSVSAVQLALLRTKASDQRDELVNELAEQERRLALLEDQLKMNDTAPKRIPLSVREVQSLLRDDELLLEYVLSESASFCIAITREAVEIVPLSAPRTKLEDLVVAELKEIAHKGTDATTGRTLYDELLKPVEKFHKPRVIIAPDGALHQLPFETLLDPHGSYAVKNLVISYINSASELRSLRAGHSDTTAREPLLAVGGVSYAFLRISNGRAELKSKSILQTLTRGFAELSGSGLPDLPHSNEEVSAIARIAGSGAVVLHNERATETAFKAERLDRFQVIHFAVHAIPDSHYPERAALVLGAAPGDSDDGLLQAREIIHFALNAELVTLSGCSTGIGTIREEAGVESLENAFMAAGARSVVASFWDVQDRSTTSLMEMFYRRLALGEDKAQALTGAKRDFMTRFGNVSPYYWAGFFLVGEPSKPVRWNVTGQEIAAPIATAH